MTDVAVDHPLGDPEEARRDDAPRQIGFEPGVFVLGQTPYPIVTLRPLVVAQSMNALVDMMSGSLA